MDFTDTLTSLFEKQVQSNPHHIAAVYGKQSLTYFELNKKANQLAHYLKTKGIKADTPVALCLDRSIEVLVAMIAILKAGAAYLPIDASQPEERLLFILKDSNASILITQSKFQSKFTNYQHELILIDQETKAIGKQKTHNPNYVLARDQLAYLIYTSGSTGIPKGVLIEHKSVVNYCLWLAQYTGLKAKDRIDFSSNYIFDMAVSVTIAPLVLGATIVICDDELKNNFNLYLKYLKRFKINLIKMTPSYLKVLFQEVSNKAVSLPHLKSIILGGEALSTADCASWLSLYPKHIFYNEYGPTETTVGVSVYKVTSTNLAALETNIPMGKEGPNINCYIFDANGALVSNNEPGELYIGGLCLARGYLNQPKLTEQQFSTIAHKEELGRLYKTGDLCRKLPCGTMEYIGRIDQQVKIRGFRIEPGEVEKTLVTIPDIDTAVVVAQKDANNENQLIGYYILKDSNKTLTNRQIRQFLLKSLPDYMIPTIFVSITSIPLTANGKLDKAALPQPQFTTNQQYTQPLTELEKAIADIWSIELGIASIGLDDDFFELGGHSLSAGRIVSKINRAFGKSIHVQQFYQGPTVAELTNLVKNSKNTKKRSTLPKKQWLNKATDVPLCDFQFLLWMSNTFEPKAKKLNITLKKRIQGQLNKDALELACLAILKKHEVFNYHISKFRPAQMLQKKRPFTLAESNLSPLSWQHSEKILDKSMNQLIKLHQWPKDSPLIVVRLFQLPEEQSELHICMPHIISDDATQNILLSDLSKLYLQYTNPTKNDEVKPNRRFKEYVFNEHYYFDTDLEKDIQFWEGYMENASLFTFPKTKIVKRTRLKNFNYSTFVKIPEQAINTLKEYCARQHISMNEGLCAVVTLALLNCNEQSHTETPYIFMNVVKSTRDNPAYDDTIGCFLRLEPIKILIDKTSTLSTLTEHIHQSTIETSLHQRCPGLIKLASNYSFRKKRKLVLHSIFRFLVSVYSFIFKIPQVYHKIFNLSVVRLISKTPKDKFLININVQSSFITDSTENNASLFGLNSINSKDNKEDLLNINNIFDVCFLRKDNQGEPFLVISANLLPDYRELIAKEVVRIMEKDTFS